MILSGRHPSRRTELPSRTCQAGPPCRRRGAFAPAACLLLAAVLRGLVAAAEEGAITGVSTSPVRLVAPAAAAAGEVLRYGLGFPLQVAPTQAAVLCNVRVEGVPTFDYENGTDIVLFDSLAGIRAAGAIPMTRNERATGADGKPRLVVKYPVIGGFVPLGARRADGSAHPHAGSGFGLGQAISFPADEAGHFSWKTERIHGCEVHQLRYDGERFTTTRRPATPEELHPRVGTTAWRITAPGITNAIPDGDDMLQPVQASDGASSPSGVLRWACAGGTWAPQEFQPVTPAGQSWSEASLVRDSDGALLFSARGSGGDLQSEVRVWRRYDGGPQWRLVFSTPDVRVLHKEEARPEWQQVLSAPGAHSPGPISINTAADGAPYIAGNLPGSGRETLCIWPLNGARTGLGEPITARAAQTEFGPAAAGARWMVDHPSAAVLRLGDGQWHGILVYRVLSSAEFAGAAPGPQSGCYVEEVFSAGPAVPAWRFE